MPHLPPLDSAIRQACPAINDGVTTDWDSLWSAYQALQGQYVMCAKRGDKAVKSYDDAAQRLK